MTIRLPKSTSVSPLAAVAIAAALLGGCSNLNHRENSALTGGAIGAAGGAVIGAVTGGSPVVGGLVGGAAGAAVGALSSDGGKRR